MCYLLISSDPVWWRRRVLWASTPRRLLIRHQRRLEQGADPTFTISTLLSTILSIQFVTSNFVTWRHLLCIQVSTMCPKQWVCLTDTYMIAMFSVFQWQFDVIMHSRLQTRSCVRQIFKETLEICVTGLGWAEHLAIFCHTLHWIDWEVRRLFGYFYSLKY